LNVGAHSCESVWLTTMAPDGVGPRFGKRSPRWSSSSWSQSGPGWRCQPASSRASAAGLAGSFTLVILEDIAERQRGLFRSCRLGFQAKLLDDPRHRVRGPNIGNLGLGFQMGEPLDEESLRYGNAAT